MAMLSLPDDSRKALQIGDDKKTTCCLSLSDNVTQHYNLRALKNDMSSQSESVSNLIKGIVQVLCVVVGATY